MQSLRLHDAVGGCVMTAHPPTRCPACRLLDLKDELLAKIRDGHAVIDDGVAIGIEHDHPMMLALRAGLDLIESDLQTLEDIRIFKAHTCERPRPSSK